MKKPSRLSTVFLLIVCGMVCSVVFAFYVYIGTYVFPIAPYWITQLPPNPPSPEIEYGEFDFCLEYKVEGKDKVIKDVLICEFAGFEVVAFGGPKKRKWKEWYKNEKGNELFGRENPETTTLIVLENIDDCKILLYVGDAEYFLNEPEKHIDPDFPQIYVYDAKNKYTKYPDEKEDFLKEHGFEIKSWYCDKPIKNEFESHLGT